MHSNLLFLLVVCFTIFSSERLSVNCYLRRIAKPSIYKWNEKWGQGVTQVVNPEVVPIASHNPDILLWELSSRFWELHYTVVATAHECGGTITEAPGVIEQYFVSRNQTKNVHCVWTIHAPENYHVYVKQLRVTRTTLHDANVQKFDDAPSVQIFDGPEALDEKRLYKFGDANLNRCLSSGQDMTIDLRYDESGKHIDHEAAIKYGFIKKSKVKDLLASSLP